MANIRGSTQFNSNLRRYSERVQASLLLFSDHFGKGKMESYAKTNAKWTDRTNMARNSLNGGGFKTSDDIISYIQHGVDYGKYLENNQGGKYAILQDTILSNKNEWENGIKRIISGGR